MKQTGRQELTLRLKEDRRTRTEMHSLFWLDPASILSLDYREAFVATNSTHVRTRRNLLDLIPRRGFTGHETV